MSTVYNELNSVNVTARCKRDPVYLASGKTLETAYIVIDDLYLTFTSVTVTRHLLLLFAWCKGVFTRSVFQPV